MISLLFRKIFQEFFPKKGYGIAVMESPKQLLNFLHHVPNARQYKVYVRCAAYDRTPTQMKSILAGYGIDANYYLIDKKRSFSYFASLFSLLLSVARQRVTRQAVLAMGDARSIVFKLLKPWFWKQISLVDDGMYLYSFINNERLMSGVTIYTNLPIPCSNKYEVIQLKNIKMVLAVESSCVVFIGSKLVDAEIVSYEAFKRSIKEVFTYYRHRGFLKQIYVPHRGETQSVLDLVASVGFVLMELNSTVEEYFSGADWFPEVLSSFYSTALYNLSCEYEGTFHSFRLKDQDLLWNEDSIKQVYRLFDSIENINVVELP